MVPTVCSSSVSDLGPRPTLSAARFTRRTGSVPGDLRTGRSSISSGPTVAAIAFVTVAVPAPVALAPIRTADQLGGDARDLDSGWAHDLDARRLGSPVSLGSSHGDDVDSLEEEVGFRLQAVACLRFGGKERAVQNSFGFARTGGAPRPGSIRARTCKFNLDTPSHALTLSEDGPTSPTRTRPLACRSMSVTPVLMVHGFASSFERNWREPGWVDVLQDEGRTVIGVDLLGHGEAEKPTDPAEYENLEKWVIQALPEGGPVDAIGFSLGGQLLLRIAAEMPHRFRKVVVGGVGDNIFESRSAEQAAAAIENGAPGEGDHETAGAFARFAQAPGNVPAALAACMRRAVSPITEEELSHVTVPVVVVLGDRDFAGPADRLMAALPDARLVTLTGADHFGTPKDFRFIDAAVAFVAN